MRRTGSWLAILAIALQALWPLLAHAKPRSVVLVPLCTVAGETHYVELETGGRSPASTHEEHCKLCPLGAGLVVSGLFSMEVSAVDETFVETQGFEEAAPVLIRHPRGPPSFLAVGMTFDNQERDDEKAVAVWHRARDAAARRGVVRRGVLLG
jgi:hypothetical protein